MNMDRWGIQEPIFEGMFRPKWQPSILNDTLAIPGIVALSFILIHILHLFTALFISWRRRPSEDSDSSVSSEQGESSHSRSLVHILRDRAKDQGGWTIFVFTVARLAGCLSLLALSCVSLMRCRDSGQRRINLSDVIFTCPESIMIFTYGYSSILAINSLTTRKWAAQATTYNMLLLLSSFAVYLYRDIWPLATYAKTPKDASEGSLLWIKLAILTATAIFVPLFVPRPYIPVDPKDPMAVPNPVQTCSWFSFIFYNYLTPIIVMGARVEHLEVDQLPPLADTDYSKNLIQNAFPHLDPYRGAKHRHLFFGLMHVFRKEYSLMALSVVGSILAAFFSPVATYRLLNYLENGPGHDDIRPWFWIFALFAGSLLYTLLYQWYLYLATQCLAHTEALLTELIFEHSLRIRLASEPADEEKEDHEGSTVVGTPETASIADTSNGEDQGAPETSTDSQSTVTESTSNGKATARGKDKDSVAANAAPVPPPKKKETKRDANLVGKINNLVTSDLGNIVDARDFLWLVLSVPLHIVLCTVFLYKVLGWSAFVGLASMVILLPAPGYAAKLVQDVQKTRMKMTDARIQKITEVVNILRMVKLFGWENKMLKQIQDTRDDELATIFKIKSLEAITGIVNSIIPTITMIITYATYAGVMRQQLTPSIIFSSLLVFNKLRLQLYSISWQIVQSTQGKVSLDRVNDFLKNTEVLDAFTGSNEEPPTITPPAVDEQLIGFKNASFSWSIGSADGSLTPSRRLYRLRVNSELFFKPDCINLIVGPTGSGKTSLLMALLGGGEMHFVGSGTDSGYNLPREGGVAYAPQESWVQNETIRENILFGSIYDEVRYRQVLRQCALEKDLELFEAGDKTEVGEKGITLSGGQKARVTLARAIYSPAKILLLDDVLAALDVHTSTWIVENCLKGDLVKGRTILLVTHHVALVSPVAQYIISIGQDGTIKTQGTSIEASISSDPVLAAEVNLDKEAIEIANEEMPSAAKAALSKGKLVLAEEVAKGHVTWKSLTLFLSSLGGTHPLVFFSLWISGFFIANATSAFQTWFLGYWGSQYETRDPSEVRVTYYLSIYSAIIITTLFLSRASYILSVWGSMRASRKINSLLVESILTSTLRWLDETPAARMIARCTQDIRIVDGPLAQGFFGLSSVVMSMTINICVIILLTPLFLFPGVVVACLGLYLGNLYLKAQLSAKREMSNAKAPVLAHFSAAIAGIVSLRAYSAQGAFRTESLRRIDNYLRISRVTHNLNRWIGTRIDLLGSLFHIGLACYLVYGSSIGASNTGFSLNMAANFCSMILWGVRVFNDFEVQSNSLERIQAYIDIDHEPKSTEAGKPPAAWPTSGDLVVDNLSARYSETGPTVLHNLSFHIKSGERVGVVGRTGSGKSSLTLSLLRCIVTEGSVYFDGIPTSTINLDALRSNITIIPQMPELLSGTLRRNLDPFDQHDDAALNDALRAAGLFLLQEELSEAHITLDSNITIGGGNLSVGEKQILALARAMLRRSKLLILDEATSAIDYKTDTVIQETLRHNLEPDVTVITVAHRLQTIMDADKIMVLEAGRIAEFDTPQALLEKEDSLFKALVDGSGDKDALYDMVESNASTSYSLQ